MTYRVALTKSAVKDLEKLDNSQLVQIKKSIVKLENVGMSAGEALRGRLSGCRKLKHRRLGLRVVFREKPEGIEIIEVIVIGKRSDNEVKIAEKRLSALDNLE